MQRPIKKNVNHQITGNPRDARLLVFGLYFLVNIILSFLSLIRDEFEQKTLSFGFDPSRFIKSCGYSLHRNF